MSAPAFAWALEQGATLKLPPAERLVLIYLADMANGKRFCWPGQETIVRFTGLALRTVRSAIRRLSERQLIRVEAKSGRAAVYHILRPETPANGAGADDANPGKSFQGTPANGAGVQRGNPGTLRHAPRQMVPQTPANRPPDPLSTQEEDPRARVGTREASEVFQDPGKGKQAAPPQPAPTPDATCDGAIIDDPPDRQVDPGAFQALLDEMQRNLRAKSYPPRAAILDRQEQISLCENKPGIARYLSGEQLAAARRGAGIGIAV